jgi:transcriptional regulator
MPCPPIWGSVILNCLKRFKVATPGTSVVLIFTPIIATIATTLHSLLQILGFLLPSKYTCPHTMYIPTLNRMTDEDKIVDFMKRFSFATIITSKDDFPVATHLPFLIKKEDEKLVLYSHFAKQNEQWKYLESSPVLVVFNEPHAYISPTHYEKELNVPTWNYITVHAYGKGFLLAGEEVKNLLENTIDTYEASYRDQWNRLPEKFQTGLMAGIVAFKIVVTDIKAKEKLSQNKTRTEQQNIVEALSGSSDSNERITAEYMKQNLEVG